MKTLQYATYVAELRGRLQATASDLRAEWRLFTVTREQCGVGMGDWHKCELRGESRRKVGNAGKEAWTPQEDAILWKKATLVSIQRHIRYLAKVDSLCRFSLAAEEI